MNNKYELTNNTKEVNGIILYQIRALRDISDIVKKGDLGGWVEKEENLSPYGSCWIFEQAQVFEQARVYGEAQVYGETQVYGKAQVFGETLISGNINIFNNAKIYSNFDYLVFNNFIHTDIHGIIISINSEQKLNIYVNNRCISLENFILELKNDNNIYSNERNLYKLLIRASIIHFEKHLPIMIYYLNKLRKSLN